MERWTALCQKAGIHLLEDCAQAHGAQWNGRLAGNFGAWGAFSFYPTKNLGAKGDAGALVTNSEEIAKRVRCLRNYGESARDEFPEAGVNSRLDEVQAALLSVRLTWLERLNLRRQEIAKRYQEGITNPGVELLSAPIAVENHVYHLFTVRCAKRDRLATALKERGIETLVRYPIPAHQQNCCRNIRCDPRGLPNTEKHAAQCLSVPCHPQLDDEEVAAVINAIIKFR
jgi:dTDP-4-amino-4,6-dideoxygalactose transaminase